MRQGDNMPHIQIIIGSTRPGRLGQPIANWFFNQVEGKYDATFEIVDIADFNLPVFNEPNLPAQKKYENEPTRKWSETIAKADGYILVTPEYNHGPAASLKNALDYLYHEWADKPVSFLGYGGFGGVRAIEQLIPITVALGMIPQRNQVQIIEPWSAIDEEGNIKEDKIIGSIERLVNSLIKTSEATKSLRD